MIRFHCSQRIGKHEFDEGVNVSDWSLAKVARSICNYSISRLAPELAGERRPAPLCTLSEQHSLPQLTADRFNSSWCEMALENTWHLRRVADNASKACWICYKPTTNVLITPNNKVGVKSHYRRDSIEMTIRISSTHVPVI